MLFSIYRPATVAALLVAACSATPTPVDIAVVKPKHDLLFREALEVSRQPVLEKRLSADFDMTRTWKNDVLFKGAWASHDPLDAESVALAITCVDCWTKGSVHASLTDPTIIDPTVKLSFTGVEAYVDMEVVMSAGSTYTITLFSTDSPISLGFPGIMGIGDLSIGLAFYVDLVFTLTEQIDLEGGFWVKLADDAFLEASILKGAIVNHFFDGLQSKSLPVTVKAGRATFTADLRLRVQCGAHGEFLGIGAGAEMGIYANIIEFNAVLETTPECLLQTTEWWDLNVGAYALLDYVVDYQTFGLVPTISTTLLFAPKQTQCWGGHSPAETGGALTTTVTTISKPASQTVSSGDSLTLTVGTDSTITAAPTPSLTRSSYATSFANSTATDGGDDVVTSTAFTTTVYTITSCAATVVNCPASYQQEIIVTETVTVCPVTSTTTPATTTSSAAPIASTTGVVEVVTDVIVLVPCETPVIETFVAPTTTVEIAHQITGSALATSPAVASASSSASASTAAAASPSPSLAGPGKAAVEKPYTNGTSTAYPSAYGTGATTTRLSTATQSPSKTAVTAGASGQTFGAGLLATLAGAAVWMVL